jgi:hypothetical protein
MYKIFEVPSTRKFNFYLNSYLGGIVDFRERLRIKPDLLSMLNLSNEVKQEIALSSDCNIYHVDVVSSYPYSMKNIECGIGFSKYTNVYMNNKIGVYKVRIKAPVISNPVLYIRDVSTGKLVTFTGSAVGV